MSAGAKAIRGWASPVAALALGGCMAGPHVSPPALLPLDWWQGMGDGQLSRLIERGIAHGDKPSPVFVGKSRDDKDLAQAPPLAGAQASLPAQIARQYIDLRAQQAALVLLARREELDAQLVTIVQQHFAGGTAPRQQVTTTQARLERTHADQLHTRGEIAALRNGLAALIGAAPGALDSLPGEAIPLPPAPVAVGDVRGGYGAARVAEGLALAEAEQARIIAALQTLRARAGTLAPDDAITADMQALVAVQAEQQARAAMTQAYVALAPGGETPPVR